MYNENTGYFDPHHEQGVAAYTSSSNNTNSNGLEDTIKLATFSIDDLSNPNPNPTSEEQVMGLDHLHHQLGFDLEQELHSHLMHGEPSMDHPDWTAAMQEVHQQPYVDVPQNLGCYDPNGSYAAAPDLLNLLQLPRCGVPPPISFTGVLGGMQDPAGEALYDSSALHLGYATAAATAPAQAHELLRDLCQSLPQSYGLYCGGLEEREGGGLVGGMMEGMMDGRQVFDGGVVGDYRMMGRGEVKGNFATEKQRREQLNEKYKALRSLVPNPTKADRASIVGDAIEYIKELHRTIKELKNLVESKKHGKERRKLLKLEEETAAADMESSSMRPHRDENDYPYNGSLRSSWLQRRSKESLVDVRVIEDEVNIKLTQKRKANCLLPVAKVLDELQLDLVHVAGGYIGNHYVFMLNTKISEGSSVYAGAIAKKLLEVMERQHTPSALPNSF